MRKWLLASLVAYGFAALALAGPSAVVTVDPLHPPRQLDYLIVAPAALQDACRPLAEYHASQGLAVGMADAGAVYAALGSGKPEPEAVRDLVQALAARAGLKYLLLAGTADPANPLCVPAWRLKARFYTEDYPCDEEMVGDALYACPAGDLAPNLAVGRLPARSAGQLRTMVAKTLACHRAAQGGPWMFRVELLAGQAFFGPAMDLLLEQLFAAVVNQTVPTHVDLHVTYANADSAYCPAPGRMVAHILRQFEAGPAALIFAGHGDYDRLARMECSGRRYELLDAPAAARLSNPDHRTAVFVIACRTGCIDGPQPCLGEALLANKQGPAAFFGASRISQPYANAVLVSTLSETLFARTAPGSVGQFVLQLRQDMLGNHPNSLRAMLDLPAMTQLGMSALAQQREDAALEYVLLADPALPLRVALCGAQVSAPPECPAGEGVTVTVMCPQAPSAQVTVLLAMRRNQTATEGAAAGNSLDEAAMNRRQEAANRKTIAQTRGQLVDGVARVRLAIPAALAAGEYGIGAVICTGGQAVGGSTSIRVVASEAAIPAEPAPMAGDEAAPPTPAANPASPARPTPRSPAPAKPARAAKFD